MTDQTTSPAEFSKGRQMPIFDDRSDSLISVITALLGEVVVLRERLDAHERLAKDSGIFSPEAVDAFVPDQEVSEQRSAQRDKMLRRVLHGIRKEVSLSRAEPEHQAIVDAVQEGDL